MQSSQNMQSSEQPNMQANHPKEQKNMRDTNLTHSARSATGAAQLNNNTYSGADNHGGGGFTDLRQAPKGIEDFAASKSEKAYRLGINTKIIGKTDPQNLSYAGAWKEAVLSLSELADHIGKGHPWMPALLDGNGKRWQSNANHAEVLAIDIDAGMTIDEALEHPFVVGCAGLLIESASSTTEHHKFRIVFALPEPIKDWQSIRICNRYLADQIGHADPACKDASRYFFGAPGREPILLSLEAKLPADFIEQAIAWDAELERQAVIEQAKRAAYLAAMPVTDRAALAKQALEFIPSYTPGNGTYNDLIVMMAGVVNDLGAEGEALLETWGGFGRETAKKVQGLSRTPNRRATLGSLFHLAKQHGFKFPKTEFTPEQKRAYAELKAAERAQSSKGFEVLQGGKSAPTEIEIRDRLISQRRWKFGTLKEMLALDNKLNEGDALEWQAQITSQLPEGSIDWYEGYCPEFGISVTPSTTYIQGWLAAGKTEAIIKSALRDFAELTNAQVIWIAPRNGLLRQIANRAGKVYSAPICHYQDNVSFNRKDLLAGVPGLYMMAPDSLKPHSTGAKGEADIDREGYRWGDAIVVIDEFSGVRKEIQRKPKAAQMLPEFERCLKEAKNLIVADAFLGQIDYSIVNHYRAEIPETIRAQRLSKSPKRIKLVETRTKDGLIAMTNDGATLAVLDQWISEGIKSIAIATDNLMLGKVAKSYLEAKGLCVSITCSETPEANHRLLPNPDEYYQANRVDVAIVTPTLQSGGDIQTPFQRGLLIGCGVLPPTQLLQIQGRFRQCDDWTVICPRHSQEASLSFSKLSLDKLENWTEQTQQSLAAIGSKPTASIIDTWGTWDSAIGEIEKAFNREYLEALFDEYFESVETIEVDAAAFRQAEMAERKAIKEIEARRTHGADLHRGAELLGKEQQPRTDAEVWDIKLAILHDKFPRAIGKLLAREQKDLIEEDLAEITIYSSRRIGKLKWWVMAECYQECDRELLDAMAKQATNGQSKRYQAYKQLKLYRLLCLGNLARCNKRDQKVAANMSHFCPDSPVVRSIYQAFCNNLKLQGLFPQVENIYDFWSIVKACLSFMGFRKAAGGNARVETAEATPNGHYRDGRQRYSRQKSAHHTGWVIMAQSGSKVFKAIFPDLIKDLHALIQREAHDSGGMLVPAAVPPDIPIAA